MMLTGFQLSAHLRLRSLLHSGWGKGKFAKASLPSPGEATKKLPHQQRLTSRGADAERQLPFQGRTWAGAGRGELRAWVSLRRTVRLGTPRSPTASTHAGAPAPERSVGTAPRAGPARGR